MGQVDSSEERLQEELTSIEYQKMSSAYAGIDSITGAVGPLFYAEVMIESTLVRAMIDTGSSATILSFKRIGRAAKIPVQELLCLDIIS